MRYKKNQHDFDCNNMIPFSTKVTVLKMAMAGNIGVMDGKMIVMLMLDVLIVLNFQRKVNAVSKLRNSSKIKLSLL